LISGIPAIYNPFYLTSNSMIDMQETIKEKWKLEILNL
jgi:hypothetical protein